MELYVLRRHFGISAHEAKYVMPRWERQMLLEKFREEAEANARG